jgi:hypothetical protein
MSWERRRCRRQRKNQGGQRLALEGLEERRLLTSSISGTSVFAVVGQDKTFDVADFQSDAALDFTSATINWGDGSASSTGTVNHYGLMNPVFDKGDITGEHTYSQAGTYTITVTAQESGSAGSGNTATVTSTAKVVDTSITPGPVLSPTVVKGVAFDALTVATFSTLESGASASDFSATIDWGDGTTPSAGSIVPLPSPLAGTPDGTATATATAVTPTTTGNGGAGGRAGFPISIPFPFPSDFEVTGGHTYTSSGPFTAKITISDGSGHSASTTASITVVDNPLVVQPISDPFQAVAGVTYDQIQVASFTDLSAGATSEDSASNYTATIDWGDNTATTSGDIEPQDVYFTAAGNVKSTAAAIAPSDSDSNSASASFDVYGQHSYSTTGMYTITVTISDQAGDTVKATRMADVTTLSLTAKGQDVNTVTGDGTDTLIVASFATNPPGTPVNPSDYSATIDWGDGTAPTSGTIFTAVLDPPGRPVLQSQVDWIGLGGGLVEGEHDYTKTGTFTIKVTITGPSGVMADATSTATVTSPTTQGQAQGIDFDATTNQADTNQTVAVFPAADSNDSTSNYKATIDWGDGSPTTTGTVSSLPNIFAGTSANGSVARGVTTAASTDVKSFPTLPPTFLDQFAVSGDHTYTKAGSYTVTVTITDQSGNTQTTTSTATVSDDAINAYPLPVDVAPSQQDVSIAVAAFHDSAGLPADDFTVTIDWGDGTTSAGTVAATPLPMPLGGDSGGTNGSSTTSDPSAIPIRFKLPYVVTGQHHYPTAGSDTIKVTIKDTLGTEADVTTTANVSTPGGAQGISFSATTNQPDTNQTVAVFPAAGSNDSASNYTATIDWGDGSPTTTGTVSSLPVSLDGTDSKGTAAPATTTGSPTIVSPGGHGTTISPPIFLDEFAISGDHTYTKAGSYTVTVTITDQSGNTQTTTSIAKVSDDTITADPQPVNIAPSQQDATITVAAFHDSANLPDDDFTVSIDWGDGSTSAGTVTPGIFPGPVPVSVSGDSGGTNGSSISTSTSTTSDPSALPILFKLPYLVTGQHHYPTAGTYTIKVTIKDTLGAEADVTTTADVSDTTPVVTVPPSAVLNPIRQPVATDPTNPVTSSNGGSQSPTPGGSSSSNSSNSSTNGTSTSSTTNGSASSTSSTATQPTVKVGVAHPGKSSRKHHPPGKTHPTVVHSAVSRHTPGGGKGLVHG